jgi:hypothetical protein
MKFKNHVYLVMQPCHKLHRASDDEEIAPNTVKMA